MSTGGSSIWTQQASQLADTAGVGALRLPLLWVTIAVALALAVAWAATCRRRILDRAGRFGDFTVPIGLAVIGSGVARLGGPIALGGAVGAMALASVTTIALMTLVAASIIHSRPTLASIGGAWFLAPAAVLADAIGIAALGTRAPPCGGALGWAAVIAAGVGASGYLVVFGLAAARVATYRLDGVARERARKDRPPQCSGYYARRLADLVTIDSFLKPAWDHAHEYVQPVVWALFAVDVPLWSAELAGETTEPSFESCLRGWSHAWAGRQPGSHRQTKRSVNHPPSSDRGFGRCRVPGVHAG